MDKIANTTTMGGALIAGFGALTITQWLAIGGFVLALFGFVANVWFKILMYRLEKEKLKIEKENVE